MNQRSELGHSVHWFDEVKLRSGDKTSFETLQQEKDNFVHFVIQWGGFCHPVGGYAVSLIEVFAVHFRHILKYSNIKQ